MTTAIDRRIIMFKYKVHYWDEIEDKALDETGLVAAESWGQAVEKVRKYYGTETVSNITVEEWNNIVCAEDIINGLAE